MGRFVKWHDVRARVGLQWEFYAGGVGGSAKWVVGDVGAAVPLVAWKNHTGVVTMTYMQPLRKHGRKNGNIRKSGGNFLK